MALNETVAVIGAGNLGAALLSGLAASGVPRDRLIAADASRDRLKRLKKELGLTRATADNREAAAAADVVVIAVKPYAVRPVVEEIAPVFEGKLVISLAAAVPIAAIEGKLSRPTPVVRAMPNLAMTVHASATALCANAAAKATHRKLAQEIFQTVGETVFVQESQMHVVTALSGSGPAYVFTMIEALAAGGVRMGLTPSDAMKLAAQTLYGAAKLALDSDEHPAALRDRVTTPGGTTVYGLHEMEIGGVRAALAAAVEAATERSIELSRLIDED